MGGSQIFEFVNTTATHRGQQTRSTLGSAGVFEVQQNLKSDRLRGWHGNSSLEFSLSHEKLYKSLYFNRPYVAVVLPSADKQHRYARGVNEADQRANHIPDRVAL